VESLRAIVPEDLHNFKFVHEPKFSPDGNEVIFAVSQTNGDNQYSTSIWKYNVKKGLVSLFFNDRMITSPTWSEDGKRFLYLTSSMHVGCTHSELWVANSNGLNRELVVSLKGSKIAEPRWSPTGDGIYFVSNYGADLHPESESDFKFATRMNYRSDGEEDYGDRWTHVFRVGLDDAKIQRLTSGDFDVRAIDVSPNAKKVAFVSNLDKEADFKVNLDIYSVPLNGGSIEKLTNSKGQIAALSFSPNGRYIAFIGDDYRYKFNTPTELWLLDVNTKRISKLSERLDRTVQNSILSDSSFDPWTFAPLWSADSREVYFVAVDGGACNIYSVEIQSREVAKVTSENQVVTSISLSKDGRIAYLKMNSTHLPELFLLQRGRSTQISDFNAEFLSRLRLSQPREFKFEARDGVEISGFFFPASKSKRDKLATVVEIHGGGGTEGFQFMHEFQCLCAQGFSVITCNFRGTRGYGAEFMRVLTGHYMEKDQSDIVDMVKFATKKGWIDERRIGVTGGSYGGYLTNWLIGHTSLFAAAVTDRSVTNLYSFYGTSDDYRRIEEDVQESFPWDKPESYLAKSPISHVKNMNTPLLLIHSEEDYRCRIEQAEQLFAFLKRLGKEVAFVSFPGESHSLSRNGKPHHRIERLKFNMWWFTSHIDVGSKVKRPD